MKIMLLKWKASKIPKRPWMTLGLFRSCHTKAKLRTRFIKHPTLQNKLKFNTYRNKFKSLCRKDEKDYYTMQFTKFKDDLKKPGKQSKLYFVRSLLTQLYPSLLLMVSKSLTASQLLSNLINTSLGLHRT